MSKYYLPSSDYYSVQIVYCDENGDLCFDSREFKSVLDKIPNIPIVIYSVTGICRSGKSFLLNALIPVLEYYSCNGTLDGFRQEDLDFHMHGENGFKYKGGSDLTTKGIHLLNTPFIIPNPNDSSKKVAVLLMDSQGLDPIDMKGGVDQALFTLTNFLSSHIMYNVCGNIEPNKLLNLISLASHSKNHRKDLFSSLDIIVRDYKFVKSNIEDMKIESKNYSSKLSYSSGSIVERNLREIQQYFRFVECYPLPYPGRIVEKKRFNGDKDISIYFIELFYDYIFVLFDKDRIVPKFENGEDLLRLFKSISDDVLNKEYLNVDEFYRIMEENIDNKIITFDKFKTKVFYPFKKSYTNMTQSEFNKSIRNIRNEYKKVENNTFDLSILNSFNFNDRITLIEKQYKRQLIRKRIEEKRIREIEKQQKILIDEVQILKEEIQYFKKQNVESIKKLIIETIST